MRRGQASLEYITIVGVLLVLLLPLFYYALNKSSENIKLSQAENTVNSIRNAADDVYALSPGTKKYVWVSIPGSVQSIQINASEISLTLGIFGKTSDITSRTKATIIGTIPIEKGTYRIPVELLDSGIVLIGSGNDSTPPVVTWKYPDGLACNPITLRATTNEPANCKFDSADSGYEQMEFQMSGSSLGHSYDLGVQSEGNYFYFVRCSDAFNNAMDTSAVINYSIDFIFCKGKEGQPINDTTPPRVTLLNPASGYVSPTSRIDFFYNVTDDSPILLCRLIANGQSIATTADPKRDISNTIAGNLDFGTYLWSVNCTDTSGNKGNSSSRSIKVNATLDSDVPVVRLSAPENGSIRNFNLIKFFYNVTDATSGIDSCTLSIFGILDSGGTSSLGVTDSSVSKNMQESITLTLEQGNHTWNISCMDNSIYRNAGISETWWIRVNKTSEEAFITSCAGLCGFKGYSNGICRQEEPKCKQNNEIYTSEGDTYCVKAGAQANACCCVP